MENRVRDTYTLRPSSSSWSGALPKKKTRTRSVSVLMSQDQFSRLDAYCEQRGHKKSTFITHLIRERLDSEAFQGPVERSRSKVSKGS
jgi:hypothetical protein